MRLIIHETDETPDIYFTDGSSSYPDDAIHWRRLISVPATDTQLRITGSTYAPSGSVVIDNGDGALTGVAVKLLGASVTVDIDSDKFVGSIRTISISEKITMDIAG